MPSATAPDFEARLQARINTKTKPLGALGRIEALAAQIARTQGTLDPRMATCQLTIFAADHGLAREACQPTPGRHPADGRELPRRRRGRQRLCPLGRRPPARRRRRRRREPVAHPDLLSRRIAPGTANALAGPAMTAAERERHHRRPRSRRRRRADAVCLGEMGIANTAAAALVAHKIAGLPLDRLVGRGTGLDDAGLAPSAPSSPAPPPAPPRASTPRTRSPNTAASRSR